MEDTVITRMQFAVCVYTGRLTGPGILLTKLCGLITFLVSSGACFKAGIRSKALVPLVIGASQLMFTRLPPAAPGSQKKKKTKSDFLVLLRSVFSRAFVKTCYDIFLESARSKDLVAQEGHDFIDCPLADMSGKSLFLSDLICKGKPLVLSFGSCT